MINYEYFALKLRIVMKMINPHVAFNGGLFLNENGYFHMHGCQGTDMRMWEILKLAINPLIGSIQKSSFRISANGGW